MSDRALTDASINGQLPTGAAAGSITPAVHRNVNKEMLDYVDTFDEYAPFVGTLWDGMNRAFTLTANAVLTLNTSRAYGTLRVQQDGTGGRTLTINGTALGINAAINAVTYISYQNWGSSNLDLFVSTGAIPISGGSSIPAAPSAAVVDDAANTFNWTNNPAFTLISDYEYTLDGGTSYSPVTTKPINIGNVAKAVGQVGVRVKAVGVTPPSTTLYNPTAFTVSGGVTPAAPTAGVVDDTADTFNWTNNPLFTALSDYEFTLNGGSSYAAVTAKPIPVGNVAKAIGQVGVRVKAAGGNPSSATLFNATAFTVAGGGAAVDLTLVGTGIAETPSGSKIWHSSATDDSWNHTAKLATLSLAAGAAGGIYRKYEPGASTDGSENRETFSGFNDANALVDYPAMKVSLRIHDASLLEHGSWDGTTNIRTDIGGAATVGRWYGLFRRNGASGVWTLEESTDETTWTVLATLTYNNSGHMWPVWSFFGNASKGFLSQPKGLGLS
jgi:hypothetical protein